MATAPHDRLASSGYAFVHAEDVRVELESCGGLADWRDFAASWNDLEVDPYLAERGRYRRRRFGVYRVDAHARIERQPHQPHYQGREYNQLFGGVERFFEPIAVDTGRGQSLQTIIRWCHRLFAGLAPPAPAWHVEVHQFRIEARVDAPGHPTPEGVHHDGVDFVLVLLIDRRNIVSGTTTVFGGEGEALGRFTLTEPLDAALVDDHRVAHGVTPVAPLDPARAAHRDVLVVTFRSTNRK
jgi:hypothetical protein